MRKSRFIKQKIFEPAEAQTPIAGVVRKMGSPGQTFYRFKKQYGGMGLSELRRLRLLEEGYRKLKQLTLPFVGHEIG